MSYVVKYLILSTLGCNVVLLSADNPKFVVFDGYPLK